MFYACYAQLRTLLDLMTGSRNQNLQFPLTDPRKITGKPPRAFPLHLRIVTLRRPGGDMRSPVTYQDAHGARNMEQTSWGRLRSLIVGFYHNEGCCVAHGFEYFVISYLFHSTVQFLNSYLYCFLSSTLSFLDCIFLMFNFFSGFESLRVTRWKHGRKVEKKIT